MELGWELIKEQIFFRKELKERVFWFIKLRWAAVALALLGTLAAHLAHEPLNYRALLVTIGAVLLYNSILAIAGRHLGAERAELRTFFAFAHCQICMDLGALFIVIYLTGGSSSPLIIFLLFHILLAGILLSRRSCFLYAIGVIGVLVSMVWAETVGVIHPDPPPLLAEEGHWVRLGFLASAFMVGAFLITTIAHSLRMKGRELLRVSSELQLTTSRLTALYEMVKEMARQTELQKLMDSATRLGATIMGVKACSIKLLDEEGRYLRFASTYGLSRDYVSKGAIEVEKSPINKRILEGAAYSIGTISRKDYFQYPEDIEREGIASMLCLPLKAGSRVLGVFCVYSDRTYHFREADTSFFSLMTDLTAMAIERLRSELSKTWFFNKAAHQLRAPLHALMSMLRVVKEGYLGPITERQLEVINRCENRLRLMGQLIDDLMRLGERRARRLPLRIEPLHIGDIARRVVSLFAEQAEKKGVSLQLEISDPVPNVLGEEGLLDEVVTNLVSNAVKYTPGGGTVRVSIGKERRAWVKLEVSDTGIGIPKSELPHLFSEFFRASNAREMEEEGTGLGLVIVKEALERLRGSIQVKTKEGEGTTFTCLIPSVLQPMERAGETDGTEERD